MPLSDVYHQMTTDWPPPGLVPSLPISAWRYFTLALYRFMMSPRDALLTVTSYCHCDSCNTLTRTYTNCCINPSFSSADDVKLTNKLHVDVFTWSILWSHVSCRVGISQASAGLKCTRPSRVRPLASSVIGHRSLYVNYNGLYNSLPNRHTAPSEFTQLAQRRQNRATMMTSWRRCQATRQPHCTRGQISHLDGCDSL